MENIDFTFKSISFPNISPAVIKQWFGSEYLACCKLHHSAAHYLLEIRSISQSAGKCITESTIPKCESIGK